MSCQVSALSCQSPREQGRPAAVPAGTATAWGLRGAAGQLDSLAQGRACASDNWQPWEAAGSRLLSDRAHANRVGKETWEHLTLRLQV